MSNAPIAGKRRRLTAWSRVGTRTHAAHVGQPCDPDDGQPEKEPWKGKLDRGPGLMGGPRGAAAAFDSDEPISLPPFPGVPIDCRYKFVVVVYVGTPADGMLGTPDWIVSQNTVEKSRLPHGQIVFFVAAIKV